MEGGDTVKWNPIRKLRGASRKSASLMVYFLAEQLMASLDLENPNAIRHARSTRRTRMATDYLLQTAPFTIDLQPLSYSPCAVSRF